MALAVPLSRFTSRVGGGSAFFVRPIRDDMNFKRPCWLTLFISLALIPVSYGCYKITPTAFRLLHIDNGKPPGPMDLIEVAFLLLMGVGCFLTVIAVIWCLFSAVFPLPHSKK